MTAARERMERVAKLVDIDSEVVNRLQYPRETLAANLPVRMDDGPLRLFKAWRCRYDDTRGPTKGGIRFHPCVSADQAKQHKDETGTARDRLMRADCGRAG